VSNLIDSGWAAWLPAELTEVYEARGGPGSARRAVAKRLADGPDAERRDRWERFALVCPSRVDLPATADGLTVDDAEHLLDQLGLGGAEPEPVELVLTLDHEQLRELEKVRSAREIGDVSTPVDALPSLDARFGGAKVGRNDPCPCGSGKKFKRCHGS
jgi:uncharacterized protein YecA (UPF0149 family)